MTDHKQNDTNKATPEDYALIFESHRVGQKILEDLIARFGHTRSHSEGIDRILDTFEKAGQRKVVDYIALQINKSHGVRDYANEDITVSVDE